MVEEDWLLLLLLIVGIKLNQFFTVKISPPAQCYAPVKCYALLIFTNTMINLYPVGLRQQDDGCLWNAGDYTMKLLRLRMLLLLTEREEGSIFTDVAPLPRLIELIPFLKYVYLCIYGIANAWQSGLLVIVVVIFGLYLCEWIFHKD
uniref:Uncharacterized protein n=1 Tax=Glossina pallidipes TaxID=7398 RepID=A0A1A9Z4I6_GLOPL